MPTPSDVLVSDLANGVSQTSAAVAAPKARKSQAVEEAPRDVLCEAGDQHDRLTKRPRPDPAAVEAAAGMFRAMGDPARLRLLEALCDGEVCVTELAASTGLPGQPVGLSTVSQQLRVLRAEGLVRRRRVGKHVFYALTDRHVAELVHNALAHASEPALKAGLVGSEPGDADRDAGDR